MSTRKQLPSCTLTTSFAITDFRNPLCPTVVHSLTSSFTKALCSLANVQQKMSTSFHPQTDGQTERVNAVVEQYLRGYCNYQQDNWSELLTMAEFSYNNTVSASTGVSPFFAMYGDHPKYSDPIYTKPSAPVTPAAIKEFCRKAH